MLTFLLMTLACSGGKDSGSARVDDVLALTGDATAGETVYADNCASCHAADASGDIGPTLQGLDDPDEDLVNWILFGKESGMPGFDGTIDDQGIADVLAYLHTI